MIPPPNRTRAMLQFSVNGRRYTVRLSLPPTALQQVKLHIRGLVECRLSGVAPDAALRGWAEATTGRLRQRLVDAGLVIPESETALGPYLAQQVASRECCDTQRRHYQRLADKMIAYWGAGRHVGSITDGARFAETLGPDGNRRRRMLAHCKRLLPAVFDGMKLSLRAVPDKKQFVSREVIERLLAVADDLNLRAVVALARFGGLRTPSEQSRMTGADIDWENGRLTVHGKGGRDRQVPLFPELRTVLMDVVLPLPIHGREMGGMTLTARLRRLCRRAGVRMWRAPFHSLRASRESELLTQYPHHVVCCWLGHSAAVSIAHYARPLNEHWESATGDVVAGTVPSSCQTYLPAIQTVPS